MRMKDYIDEPQLNECQMCRGAKEAQFTFTGETQTVRMNCPLRKPVTVFSDNCPTANNPEIAYRNDSEWKPPTEINVGPLCWQLGSDGRYTFIDGAIGGRYQCGASESLLVKRWAAALQDLEELRASQQSPLAWAVQHDGCTASIFPTREDAERNCDWHLQTFPHVRASVSPLYGLPKTHKEISEVLRLAANSACFSDDDRDALYFACGVLQNPAAITRVNARKSEAQAAEANNAVDVQYDNVEICDALRDVAYMGDLSEEDKDVLYLAASVIEDLRDRLGEEK
jgi:hypothetical protein